jgi:hypothetical protein
VYYNCDTVSYQQKKDKKLEGNRMKNVKKNLLKTLVLIALICPAAFADGGDMGGGGLTAPVPVKVEKSVRTTEDGDMGGGGRLSDEGYINWLISSVRDYIGSVI